MPSDPRKMEFWKPAVPDDGKTDGGWALRKACHHAFNRPWIPPVETCCVVSIAELAHLDTFYRPQWPLGKQGVVATIERDGQQHYRWRLGNQVEQGFSPR